MYRGSMEAVMRCIVALRLSSSHQAWPPGIELPVGNEALHGDGVIARAKGLTIVEVVRALDSIEVEFNAEAGSLGHCNHAVLDLERIACQLLSVLPDPMRVHGRDSARCGRGDMRDHGERDIEVVVGVRAPSESVIATSLRHMHRALHGPEMRIDRKSTRLNS